MELTQHYDITWIVAAIFCLVWLCGAEMVYLGAKRLKEYIELRRIRQTNNHLTRYTTRG
jgi:hypothetical protein